MNFIMAKDINRLKVVLVEKKEPINGLQNNYIKILQQFQSGVQMFPNHQ